MKRDTKDIEVSPAGLGMTLEDLLREGARDLIEKAVAMDAAGAASGGEEWLSTGARAIDANRTGGCADPEGARPLWG